MKLIISIVHDADAPGLTQALVEEEHRVTRMASMGGFLRRGNSTLFIGTEDERVDEVLSLIKDNTHPRQELSRWPGPAGEHIGAAVVFVLNLGRFERIALALEE